MAETNRTLAGRRHAVVKALLVSVDREKMESSKALLESDTWSALAGQVLDPPFDLLVLTMLSEQNTEMGPCLDAMQVNCDGFGHRLKPRVDLLKAKDDKELLAKIAAERTRLTNFFAYASLEHSFMQLRKMRRRDFEATGNAFWEIIRSASGSIQSIEHLPAHTMRLVPSDQKATPALVPILELQVDGSVEIVEVKASLRFRRYVQQRDARTWWFRQLGDPRVVDCENGDYVPPEKVADWDGSGNPMPPERRASEVCHWALYSGRSPYGIPRYLGALLSIFGDREAESINFTTFKNNNIPSMIIAVSNGQLTQEAVDRIKEFSESNIQGRNYSKFLVLEAEGAQEGDEPANIKIDIKPLADAQKEDALFLNYSKENRDKVRRQWRLPPILVGRADDYTRATADTSRRLADEQVFAPEREDFDDWVNRTLFPRMGIIYHKFHSNSPNTTDNQALVSMLGGAEKSGGMTPRIGRMILEDVLNQDLPELSEKFDVDIPFSLTMADAVKNMGDPSEVGQAVTALKAIDALTGDAGIERLLGLRTRLDKVWREEVVGPIDEPAEDDEE